MLMPQNVKSFEPFWPTILVHRSKIVSLLSFLSCFDLCLTLSLNTANCVTVMALLKKCSCDHFYLSTFLALYL